MLFALYEAPITKVLWAGYIGQQPIASTFLGIASFEFLTLVFFWHPIFSFVLPILILEQFLANQESAVIEALPPSHLSILKNSRLNRFLSSMIFLIASPFLIHNSG